MPHAAPNEVCPVGGVGYASPMRTRTFLLVAAVFFLIVAVAAAISGGLEWAIPIAIVAAIVGAYAGVNKKLADSELSSHGGDADRALRDGSEGGLPKTHILGDDETALGDTPEVHREISPHDFPKGAPERQAAEEMAERESQERDADTTRGHADPSEREGRVGHESETPPR
jgi:hypothetical protein